MGSFLPIKWPASDVLVALMISVLSVGVALNEVGLERSVDFREIASLTTTLVAVLFIWSLIAKRQSSVEAAVSERTASLSQSACYLQGSLESERLALSQELHDELGAILTMAKLDVARLGGKVSPLSPALAACLKDLDQSLNAGLALKSKIVEDLRPSGLSHLGLSATLEDYLSGFQKRVNLEVDLSMDFRKLDTQTSLIAFRIVQESLTNIVRHAQAGKVTVSLKENSCCLHIVIKDDGIGFESSQAKSAVHGIAGMSHRANSVGGRLEISSRAGAGTTVYAVLPVNLRIAERRNIRPSELRLNPQSLTSSSIF